MAATRLKEAPRSSSPRTGDWRHSDNEQFRFRRLAAVGALASLGIVSAVLVARRLAGAFIEPLPDTALIAIVAAMSVCAAIAHWLPQPGSGTGSFGKRQSRSWNLATAAALVAAVGAITHTGNSVAGAVLAWCFVAAELGAAAFSAGVFKSPQPARVQAPYLASVFRAASKAPSQNQAEVGDAHSTEIWQQQTRERKPDGSEVIHGTLRVAFASGQRTAIEHLQFCPLLAATPRIMAEALDEFDCAVRATHGYRYGARLEVKLRETCDEPFEVLIRYEVHA